MTDFLRDEAAVLLLDQGNTRLKWVLANATGVLVARGFEQNTRPLSDVCRDVSGKLNGRPISIVACNVAGSRREAELSAMFSSTFGAPVRFLSHTDSSTGLRSDYLRPQSLGIDRWLCMTAAKNLFGGPLVVVSAGTAVTVDVVDALEQHLGGYIVPGIRGQLELLSNMAVLPKVEYLDVEIPEDSWGRATEVAMLLGVLRSLASLILRSSEELQASVGSLAKVVLTGGDAQILSRQVGAHSVVADALLFQGMWMTIFNKRSNLLI